MTQRSICFPAFPTRWQPDPDHHGTRWQIERCMISTYQIAQSLGFKGGYRAWEHLLRIHE